MSIPQPLGFFEHFARVGYAVIAFNSDADARKAQGILITEGHTAEESMICTSKEIVEEITRRQANQTLSEIFGYGFDVESLDQIRDLALQGCAFMNLYMSASLEEEKIIAAVKDCNVRLVRKYGTFVISDVSTRKADAV